MHLTLQWAALLKGKFPLKAGWLCTIKLVWGHRGRLHLLPNIAFFFFFLLGMFSGWWNYLFCKWEPGRLNERRRQLLVVAVEKSNLKSFIWCGGCGVFLAKRCGGLDIVPNIQNQKELLSLGSRMVRVAVENRVKRMQTQDLIQAQEAF